MKRFLVFYGSIFYTKGGMKDFVDSFDTLKEAIEEASDGVTDNKGDYYGQCEFWSHVYDSKENKIVYKINDAF